ncbi:MAG: hypothetical protein LUC93_14570 [Planctomycetaceae bacterium]|nr:hypothetical protein [Planctomycetaceae bacterium]
MRDHAYLLQPDFDLNAALTGPEAAQTLRDARDCLASRIHRWRSEGRGGFPVEEYKRWNRALDGLRAAESIVASLEMLIEAGRRGVV